MFFYLQKLRASWSKKLGELAKDIFVTSVSAQSVLPAERCEELWLDLEQELVSQLQQAECTTKLQLEDMRAQLDKDGQVETICQIINKYSMFNVSISPKSEFVSFDAQLKISKTVSHAHELSTAN